MEDKISLSISTSYLFTYDFETGNWRCQPYPQTYVIGESKFEILSDTKMG